MIISLGWIIYLIYLYLILITDNLELFGINTIVLLFINNTPISKYSSNVIRSLYLAVDIS